MAGHRRYLAFRHRFRNLYLLDLEAEQMAPLAQDAADLWTTVQGDLKAFCDVPATLAGEVEHDLRQPT